MNNSAKSNMWKVLLSLVIIFSFAGCGEMLDDPTIDKDTGEDINLLIVDFNFFTTRTSYKFIDASDNSVITRPAKMWFTGTHANDIVNFAGKKNSEYNTSEGQMELTVDPNLDITASSPIQFAVHVEIDGYLAFSQGIQINSEGKKTFELLLTKESDGEETTITGEEDGDSFTFLVVSEDTKSASTVGVSFEIRNRLSKVDVLKLKSNEVQIFATEGEMMAAFHEDPNNFLIAIFSKENDYPLIIDRMKVEGGSQMVSLQKLETGRLKALSVGGKTVTELNGAIIHQNAEYKSTPAPDVFGFADFKTDQWEVTGTEIGQNSLHFSYTLISASLEALCATACNINFASNSKSSFSIDADIYDSNKKLIKSTNFKGNFPETFTLENMPAQSANIVFRDNNPSFKEIPDLEISNLCSGNYEVDVDPADGYEEYQIVLKAICTDNTSIAVAPTYSGEIRIKNSNDAWQGVDMLGGKVDLLAKPNQEYELRLLWEDQWETATFGTEFDANGNYVNKTSSNITSEKMEDGRTRIKVIHEFDQSICDDMDW